MDNTKIITDALKQTIFEIFDEEMISQISACIRRIVAEELAKNK